LEDGGQPPSTATDAGTGGGGGGTADGGGPSDSGTGGGGETDAGPGGSGGGQDAGTGGGGTDGGAQAADCQDLVPSQHFVASRFYRGPPTTASYGSWNPGFLGFDRNGFLGYAGLQGVYDPDQGPIYSGVELSLLASPDSAVGRRSFPTSADQLFPFVQPTSVGLVVPDASADGTLVTVDETGAFRQRSAGRVTWLDTVPWGGTVVVTGGQFGFADGGTIQEPHVLTRRDENLDPVWSVPLSLSETGDTVIAFVNAKDHVLLVVNHPVDPYTGTQKAYWLDGAGHVVRSFVPDVGIGVSGVAKLADGALAFLQGGDVEIRQWVEYVLDLDASAPVPQWLKDRPETRVKTIRGGRGVAVFYDSAPDDPSRPALEILRADGHTCGLFKGTCSANGGDPCVGRYDVGLDGTLYTVTTGGPMGDVIDLEAWPGLLK
jgi:hypothetical protein